MAGIFGFFDYTKPGPGVPKDAPPKHPFIVFFEILQRKFWNFVKINLMFLVFNLPAFLAGMFVMLAFFPNIIPDALESPEGMFNDIIMKFVLLTVMMCVPMITTGPSQAGFTYILRNYSREEHAFIWGDFKDAAKSNFSQSLIVGTINFIVTFLTIMAIMAYWKWIDIGQIQVAVGLVGLAVMFQMLLLFACMNIYIYQLMVTFDLTLIQLYKNALILAIVRFIPNLLILLLTAFIVFLSFGLIFPFNNPLIGLVPYLFLLVSLTGFIINFYAWRTIRKYIISRIEEEEEDDDDDEGEDEEDDDEDADDDEGDDEGSGNDSGDAGIGGNGRGKDQDPGTDTGAGAGVVGEDGITRYF